jgi:hypothetical protein
VPDLVGHSRVLARGAVLAEVALALVHVHVIVAAVRAPAALCHSALRLVLRDERIVARAVSEARSTLAAVRVHGDSAAGRGAVHARCRVLARAAGALSHVHVAVTALFCTRAHRCIAARGLGSAQHHRQSTPQSCRCRSRTSPLHTHGTSRRLS